LTWTKVEVDKPKPSFEYFSMRYRYTNGMLFIATEYGDEIRDTVYSKDRGATWTAIDTFKSPNTLLYMVYGNGVFVAKGSEEEMLYTSSDGVVWTKTNASFTSDVIGLRYGNEKFFAILGMRFMNGGGIASSYAVSDDGVAWSSAAKYPLDNQEFNGIAFGGGTFIIWGTSWSSGARAVNGKAESFTEYKTEIARSTDGVNWTKVDDSILSAVGINGITYGNGKFVAVGDTGSKTESMSAAYSINGVTWIPVGNLPFSGDDGIQSIAFGNGIFVAAGGGITASSTDGITWTKNNPLPFEIEYPSVAFDSGKFVITEDDKVALASPQQ
jgi:hypothetical protein